MTRHRSLRSLSVMNQDFDISKSFREFGVPSLGTRILVFRVDSGSFGRVIMLILSLKAQSVATVRALIIGFRV